MLTAGEMSAKLTEWGIEQPLENYIGLASAAEILADQVNLERFRPGAERF